MFRPCFVLLFAAVLSDLTAFSTSAFGQTIRQANAPAIASSFGGVVQSPCKASLDDAVRAFKQNDTFQAMELVNAGLVQCPGDLDLHEFRALVLFARGNYHEASVSIHKVLGSRNGWNWATVYNCYPDLETYTSHLRALETYSNRHPDDGAARFLQAYHYNVGGYQQAAVRELEMVVRLEYSDPIAAAWLRKLAKTTPALSGRY